MAIDKSVVCVVPTGDRCGEGAVWSADERALYWTDINRFLIHRLRPADNSVHTWMFDEPVVALALTSQPGTMLVALGSRIILWRPAGDERRDHGFTLPGSPAVRLNDGRPDPAGLFWVGSMRNNVGPNGEDLPAGGTDGVLYRIARNGEATVWRRDLGIANTLCWSPDRRTFYFADTLANEIRAYDYDPDSSEIANERPFFSGFERGSPDGSAIDSRGYVWNCRYGGQCIVRIAPDGQIDRIIEMPVRNITTCTFGGPDLKTLYITTASDPGDRLGGSLFSLAVDVPGLPEHRVLLG
ncbi:Sugar lactone lactonase YvrE [Pseudoxanthobacter soli DSM 19599]|uniref:Sugar lactone lactonase YvrE n=1 Tax=Pseudoxanthobacter soli DSM 19599 TaxID=1123029 RepID=A0A1M7Z6Q0_9HYPH|nr:SMP-30/gluconolactonase/LRE family protein [Pseudoxanthobacter soli]SHO60450.1 Sugar lactone lactonase YvrE [Pseudoxanthobacter soli DSM 19599]